MEPRSITFRLEPANWQVLTAALTAIIHVPMGTARQDCLLSRAGDRAYDLWNRLIEARDNAGVGNPGPIPIILPASEVSLLEEVLLICLEEFALDPVSISIHLSAANGEHVCDVLDILDSEL